MQTHRSSRSPRLPIVTRRSASAPCCTAIILLAASIASSQPASRQAQETIRAQRQSFLELGLNVHYFTYSEIFDKAEGRDIIGYDSVIGVVKSDEYGLVPSFETEVTFLGKKAPLFSRLSFQIGGGQDTYDGAEIVDADSSTGITIVTAVPYTAEKKNRFIGTGFNIGAMIRLSRLSLLPYVGVEFHHWKRFLPGGTIVSNERYSWLNVPAGLWLRLLATDRVEVGLDMAARYMFYGRMSVGISSAAAMYDIDVNFTPVTLGKRWGWRAQCPCHFRGTLQGLGFGLTPWAEYRHFGRSTIGSGQMSSPYTGDIKEPYFEPESNHYSWGAKFALLVDSRIFESLSRLAPKPPRN